MARGTSVKLIFPLITACGKIIAKPSTLIAGHATPEEGANQGLPARRGGGAGAGAARGSLAGQGAPAGPEGRPKVFFQGFFLAIIRNMWPARRLPANGFRITGIRANPELAVTPLGALR